MGCITSRGEDWPPRPYKRLIVRNYREDDKNKPGYGEITTKIDYVWVYPGAEIANGCGGVAADWSEETSPGQEIGIRCLEDS